MKAERSDERIEFIDLAKGIAISLMVLCHCGFTGPLRVWIYAFHMPFFFIVSGYVKSLLNRNQRDILVYLKKSFLTIIVPYILFALIYCFGNNGFKDWVGVFYGSRDSLAAVKCATPLWFLPCFFIASVLFEIVLKIDKSWLRGASLVSCRYNRNLSVFF